MSFITTAIVKCVVDESAKLRALRAKNVRTCKRALLAYALMCQRALRSNVLTCQHVLHAHVLTSQRATFDATIFSFGAIVAEVIHTPGKI